MNRYQRNWLKALRSGNFPQVSHVMKANLLATDDDGYQDWDIRLAPNNTDCQVGYCCLGVEHQVNGGGRAFDAEDTDDDGIVTWGINVNGDVEQSHIPHKEREQLGLTELDIRCCTHLNDTLKLGFAEIADVMEHVFKDGSIDVVTAATELGYTAEHAGYSPAYHSLESAFCISQHEI